MKRSGTWNTCREERDPLLNKMLDTIVHVIAELYVALCYLTTDWE